MVQEYHIGDEPIPGYRLTKFLGRGGFGEVWQAVAPGRTEVALKIISLDRKQGMKEFRSLRLVKRIRHPNLVPILAFWLKDSSGNVLDDDSIDMLDSGIGEASARSASVLFNAARADQLVIAMGLGDMNLLALLQDYQAAGQAGIPAEELLDYMEGCARAIDYLNTARHDLGDGPVAIQHCDIKPQNIMIVGDAVQLCDFGLARSLTDVRSTSVAGSIAYGAPELFWENKPSGATDQYSLAISYYELRTGCLPFGLEMAQLEVMQAHRDGTLDLSRVDDGERAVLVRATAPSPADRFARTIDMVRALRRAIQSASHVEAIEPPPPGRSNLAGSALLESGREILPGYRLLEHLFYADSATDVWSAAAPGAKQQALWIYDLSRAEGRPDLASLRMAQKFANPHLARLSEFWFVDEAGDAQLLGPHLDQAALASCRRLIAVSDLTRTNLAHRLEECRESLGTGIPQPELLAYMRMTAEGLDALNAAWHPLDDARKASLLHRDLRPENLLLFHHDVKIGNLAWVRALESDAMQLPESARRPTRIFSAPELARDRLTRWSDQYALAVCYAVMRTGKWMGNAPSGAIQPGLQQLLDPAALPPAEAEVLAKALHARPEQRFADCRQMVAALEKASRASPLADPAIQPETKPAAPWYGTIVAPSAQAAANAPSGEVQLAEAAVAGSIADTNPEPDARRSTLVEPFPPAPVGAAAPSIRPRRLTRALAAAVLAGAFGAAFMIGDDAQHVARQLAGEQRYKQAIESLDDASWWRRWRIDRGELRRTIVSEAVTAAQSEAAGGETAKACSIFAELAAMPDVLVKADIDDFREKILPAAIEHAKAELADGKYRQAGEVQRQLAGVFAENVEVVGLGQAIVNRASAAAIEHARLDDFEPAADIYLQLHDFAPAADAVQKLRTELIEMGLKAVDDRVNRDDVAGGLAIYRSLKKAFDDHGVAGAGSKLIDKALGAIRDCLKAGQIVEAKVIYRELSQLLPDASDVEKLGDKLRATELVPAEKLLADGKWAGALAIYERTASSWPPENPRLEALKKTIIKSAVEEINETSADMGPEQAIEAAKTLSAAFPGDPQITALADKIEKARGSSDAPERVAVELLDRIDSDFELGEGDRLDQSLKQAQQELEKLPGREKLQRRLMLARGHAAVLQNRWEDANRYLADFRAKAFAGNEAGQRIRLNILWALALARFDGGTLDASANLLDIGRAAAAVVQDDAEWRQGNRFPLEARRFDTLTDQLLARSMESAYSDNPAARLRASEVLASLDPLFANAPANATRPEFWAAKTHLLLAGDPRPDRDAVVLSLAKWRDRAGEIEPDHVAALSRDLSNWAGDSPEQPEALGTAIAALGQLRQLRPQDDAPKAKYAELLIRQLEHEATSPLPNWPDLLKKCQGADEALTVAARDTRRSFVKACWAECLLEESSDGQQHKAAATLLKDALALPTEESDRPYIDYVSALAIDLRAPATGIDDVRKAATTVYANFGEPVPILETSNHKKRAADMLIAAAVRLVAHGAESGKAWEAPAISEQDASQSYDWLKLSQSLSADETTEEFKLAWAAAAIRKDPADDDAAAKAVLELIRAERREPWLLVRGARAVSATEPMKAIRLYALALEQIDLDSAAGASSSELYNDVVQPAIELVERNTAALSDELKPAIAELYSAKGRLVRLDASLASADRSQDQEAFDAADKAIEYDGTKAAYYVQRGFARWSRDHGRLDLVVFQSEDIDPAFKLGEPSAGAFGLLAHAQLTGSREKTGAEALALLKGAREYYDLAIDGSSRGPYYTDLLDGGAAAYVDLANFDEDSSIDERRGYLNKAVELAKKSSTEFKYRPNPEFALLNLGNAEEDLTYVIGDKGNHYCEAIKAFGEAARVAGEAGRSPASALYSQGRCRYKLVDALISNFLQVDQGCDDSVDEHIRLGLNELQGAIVDAKEESSRAKIAAESSYWQVNFYLLQASRLNDKKKANEVYALANAAALSASELVGETDPDWSKYQVLSTRVAFEMGSWKIARARAERLINARSAPIAKKAIGVRYLADSYRQEGDLQGGLEKYKKYLATTDFREAGREAAKARVDLLTMLSRHIGTLNSFWRNNRKLCGQSARDAIKLAEEIKDSTGAATAYIALSDHLLKASIEDRDLSQYKEYTKCLAKLIDYQPGLPASLDWRIRFADASLSLAKASTLSADEQMQNAEAGYKAIKVVTAADCGGGEWTKVASLSKDLKTRSKSSK